MSLLDGTPTIYDTMIEFFRDTGWSLEMAPGQPWVTMGLRGNSGAWRSLAEADNEKERFFFYSFMPVNVPEERRPAMAELLARINYGLALGNFDLDFRDGEVRYRTSIDIAGGRLEPRMMQTLVSINLTVMDRFFPVIMKVIFTAAAPAAALEEAA
jgi:hypothetical protein